MITNTMHEQHWFIFLQHFIHLKNLTRTSLNKILNTTNTTVWSSMNEIFLIFFFFSSYFVILFRHSLYPVNIISDMLRHLSPCSFYDSFKNLRCVSPATHTPSGTPHTPSALQHTPSAFLSIMGEQNWPSKKRFSDLTLLTRIITISLFFLWLIQKPSMGIFQWRMVINMMTNRSFLHIHFANI